MKKTEITRWLLVAVALLFWVPAAMGALSVTINKVTQGTIHVGNLVTFDASTSVCSGTNNVPTYVTWDFGDGFFLEPYRGGYMVSHAYRKAGTFTATMTLYDPNGTNMSGTCEVTIAGVSLPAWPLVPSSYESLHLSFEDNLTDESPTPKTVSVVGSAEYYAGGIEGKAITCDGNYVSVADHSALEGWTTTNGFTISLWYKKKTATSVGCLLHKADVLQVSIDNYDGSWVQLHDNNWSTTQENRGGSGLSNHYNDRSWHHFLWTWNGTVWRVYWDGIDNSSDVSGNIACTVNCDGGTGPLAIGAKADGTSPFDGYIDEVRVINRYMTYDQAMYCFEVDSANHTARTKQYINYLIPPIITADATNKLVVTISKDGGAESSLYSKNSSLAATGENFLMDYTALNSGLYTIYHRIKTAADATVYEVAQDFNKPYDGAPEFAINEYNRFLLNGSLFFPMSSWDGYATNYPGTGDNHFQGRINVALRWSFNATGPATSPTSTEDPYDVRTTSAWLLRNEYMEDLGFQSAGPGVFSGFNDTDAANNRNRAYSTMTNYYDLVRQNADANNFTFYHLCDEPDMGLSTVRIPVAVMAALSECSRCIDPCHPTNYTCMGNFGATSGSAVLVLDALKWKYNWVWLGGRSHSLDYWTSDYYPYGHRDSLASMKTFYDNVAAKKIAGRSKLPVGPCIECAKDSSSYITTPGTAPTDVIDMEVALSICAGASGFEWYHWGDYGTVNWSGMATTYAKYTALTPQLMATPSTKTITVSDPNIKTLATEPNANTWIMAVRLTEPYESTHSESITLDCDDLAYGTLTVYGESRTVSVGSDGTFTDTFDHNDVHIYYGQAGSPPATKYALIRNN